MFALVAGMAPILLSVSCPAAPAILDWMSPRLSLSTVSPCISSGIFVGSCVWTLGPFLPLPWCPRAVSTFCLYGCVSQPVHYCLGYPRFGVFPELLQGIPSH